MNQPHFYVTTQLPDDGKAKTDNSLPASYNLILSKETLALPTQAQGSGFNKGLLPRESSLRALVNKVD